MSAIGVTGSLPLLTIIMDPRDFQKSPGQYCQMGENRKNPETEGKITDELKKLLTIFPFLFLNL